MKKLSIFLSLSLLILLINACCSISPRSCCDNGKLDKKEITVDCGGKCDDCTCDDDIHNQGEEKTDCGGPCPPCPTCDDGIQNQEETGIDCGGPCALLCQCIDGEPGPGELSIDCGGPCPTPPGGCPTGNCNDGVMNGTEEGVDCGGNDCRPCTCYDGQLTAGESDIDCGGPCAPCHCFNCDQDGDETGVNCGGSCEESCSTTNIDMALMIRDLDVVERSDEARLSNGKFHIRTLFSRFSPTQDAKGVMLSLLSTWRQVQRPNRSASFTVPARPIDDLIIDKWKTRDGQSGVSDVAWNMNFDNAPFRLLAIVNRLDLHQRDSAGNVLNAGEGRFVFGLLDPSNGSPLQFTIILEYKLPASSEAELKSWADRWKTLEDFPSFNQAYINALSDITDDFATCENLNQMRTNEISLGLLSGSAWELRELHINCGTGSFEEVTRKRNPDQSFVTNSAEIRDFINNNAEDIVIGNEALPDDMLAGNVLTPTPSFFWNPAGVTNNLARHRLSLNTCNGCHGGESDTDFTQVKPRQANQPARLASFLTGGCVTDPVDGTPRFFSDLENRAVILEELTASPAAAAAINTGRILAKRRNRTH